MPDSIGEMIKNNWQLIAVMFSGVFGLGVVRAKLVTKDEMNKKLFKADGTLIYETSDNCEKTRTACIAGVTKELNNINDMLILSAKKDDARDETLTDVRLFLAELKGERNK